MDLEVFNEIIVFFLHFIEVFEGLNSDEYPKNYVEIDGELVEYVNQT